MRRLLAAAICCSLSLLGSAASAGAASPWWHLTTGTRPSDLPVGGAKEEVQELTVSATGGELFLAEPNSLHEVEVGRQTFEELKYAVVSYDASAAQVREAIATKLYPSLNVTVTEKPMQENTRRYVISFPGVAPIFANGLFAVLVSREPLSCAGAVGACTAEAQVSEIARGSVSGQVVVTAANLGDTSTGAETQLIAHLPPGLTPVYVEGIAGEDSGEGAAGFDGPVNCSLGSLSCAFKGALGAYHQIEVLIGVDVDSSAHAGETVQASVTGGGAPGSSVERPLVVSGEQTPFGVSEYQLAAEEEGGTADTQAGSHPFQLTTTLNLNQVFEPISEVSRGLPLPAQLAKDLHFKLPPGLIGNPTPFSQCTMANFVTFNGETGENKCSPQTAVGVARITIAEEHFVGLRTFAVPVFNLEPSVGEPARFGFTVAANPVVLDTAVRTGGDYGVTVSVDNIVQTAGFMKNEVTFWGVPGDPRHDAQRGWGCLAVASGHAHKQPCNPTEPHNPPPLLSMPTSCTGPLTSSVETDSWVHKGAFETVPPLEPMPALDGCNRLPFSDSIKVTPDGQAASTPTGLSVDVHVPQDEALNPTGLAPSQVRNTTVTLPAGMALNPAAADGLQSCSEAQVALSQDAAALCPEASKVGTVEIKTPLLPNPLVGSAYLAAQNANPFGSLVALYVDAEDPVSGSLVKLSGEVKPDPITGQLLGTFLNTPQLPFEDFTLHFFGGDRAPLSTPANCGSYTTTASIEPWSGNPPTQSSSEFDVVSGPNGGPCHSPLVFNPSLTAGTTSIQAGGFTPFAMTMSREDGEQNLQGIQLKMPLGMSGTLTSVKLCGEAQANAGTCGPESEIGETIVSVGVGGDPYTVRGGKVYITGPYKGAPFGLSIVNPAKAGPFDLGKVVVRARIDVNEETAALTITTDNEGPYKIPTIIDGIPLQIKHVNVNVNRPGFTFNATNCSPLQITGALTSTEGATSALAVPYQVTNCAVLAFKPKLTASTTAHSSRANGASLHVKLGYPAGPFDANIARVKVELPKALPSRLTTLQKACLAQVFEANPADCPAASIVGHATATTPVLPVPLTGPAYFVSHGGEAFPSLIVVLQGYGVTVHLVGSTFISPKGITSSTFKSVPDVPVGSFELTLPQGPYSALTANTNLCKANLGMPTEFVGQNGAEIHTTTKIAVTGCRKAKRVKHTKHKRRATGRKQAGTRKHKRKR